MRARSIRNSSVIPLSAPEARGSVDAGVGIQGAKMPTTHRPLLW
jgi:hypothetical protein